MRRLFDALNLRKTAHRPHITYLRRHADTPINMPEVIFTVELPDGATKECYSPSSVVCRYFAKGEEMRLAEFVQRSRKALAEASERVRAKFGFGCSSAAAQLSEIEHWSQSYTQDAVIRIVSI